MVLLGLNAACPKLLGYTLVLMPCVQGYRLYGDERLYHASSKKEYCDLERNIIEGHKLHAKVKNCKGMVLILNGNPEYDAQEGICLHRQQSQIWLGHYEKITFLRLPLLSLVRLPCSELPSNTITSSIGMIVSL